ncbi:MAG: hypothetical protein A2Y21_01270 [Clostridiales bacterium GWC2_40_7]|nr:MAG: hypothetical protein A2Y21_01270 [Clostridiales bacterium GWC2_40_7]
MDRNEDEDTYIIPHNYSDNGKILGIVEKQSLYFAAAWFVPMTFLNFKFLPFSVDVKIFVLILLILPPTLFILIGVGGDTLLDFLRYVYSFYKNARIYHYEK